MGLGMMIFTDSSSLVGSSSIEIAETNELQAIRPAISFERVLECQLGRAIRIDRLTRASFGDRAFCRIAINRRSRREDEPAYPRIHHRIQQCDGCGNIVVEIFSWIFY